MELRHLRSFVVLAQMRHFGRAAEELHIAQPALSQQLKQLERELGVTLLARTTRRVEVTEAGHRLAAHARAVLDGVDRARDDLALLASGHAGRVRVGFIGSATYDLLPRVAREVRADNPEIELSVRGELLSPQLVEGLVDGTYDLAVVRPYTWPHLRLHQLVLRSEQLVAVLPTSHPLANEPRISLAGLANETFVMHPSNDRSSIHAHVLAACEAAGFHPVSTIEVSETATLVVFVAAGLGVALVPEPVRSLALDGVTYVRLLDPPSVELALAWRVDASPAMSRVAASIKRSVSSGRS